MRNQPPTLFRRPALQRITLVAAALAALLLGGCGGGGSDGSAGTGTQPPPSSNWGEMPWGTGTWSN